MDRVAYELGIFALFAARLLVVAPARLLWAVLCAIRQEILDTLHDLKRITED